MLSLPNCRCAELSIGDSVFTCPECVAAAIRFMGGERVDQAELFSEIDSTSSVSGLPRPRSKLTHISEVLRPYVQPDDGLPF